MILGIVSLVAGLVLAGLIRAGRVTEQLRGLAVVLVVAPLVYGLLVVVRG